MCLWISSWVGAEPGGSRGEIAPLALWKKVIEVGILWTILWYFTLIKKKKKTPTLIHVQTFNTKKVGKKNLLPRIKSYHFCTKFTILISFILPPRLHPFHRSFFSQPLFSVYYSQHFSCEVMLWMLQILQIDLLSIIKKIHSNIYLLYCLSIIHSCHISLWVFYSRIYSRFSFEKFYVHNILTTILQQILSNRLLLIRKKLISTMGWNLH